MNSNSFFASDSVICRVGMVFHAAKLQKGQNRSIFCGVTFIECCSLMGGMNILPNDSVRPTMQ